MFFLSFREAHFFLVGYFSLYRFLAVISLRNPWAVVPRSTLPLLYCQFKHLGCILCEECGHLPSKLFAVDRDIDFIVPHQAQTIEITRSDR